MTEYSFTNLQIKSNDPAKVRQAIDICDIGSAKMLARAGVEWIGVYPFLTEDDFSYLKEVSWKLSEYLDVPVLGVMVPNPAEFRYALFHGKHHLGEYSSGDVSSQAVRNSSAPNDAEVDGNQETQVPNRTGSNIDELQRLCVKGTSRKELESILHPPTETADQSAGDKMAAQLAHVLGIPRVQLCTGYNYLKWAEAPRRS